MTALSFFWLILIVLCLVAEALTQGVTAVWFAAGALVALLSATIGATAWFQWVNFLLVSGLLLSSTRPLVRAYLDRRTELMNAGRLVGSTCKVTEAIDNVAGTGAVVIDGRTWAARAECTVRFEPGDEVRIERLGGGTAYVVPAPVEEPEAYEIIPDPEAFDGVYFERSEPVPPPDGELAAQPPE